MAATTPLTDIGRIVVDERLRDRLARVVGVDALHEALVDRRRGLGAARERLAVGAPDEPEARVADPVGPFARAALLVVVEVAGRGVGAASDVDAQVGGVLRLRVAGADDVERPVHEAEDGDREDVVGVEVAGWVATRIARHGRREPNTRRALRVLRGDAAGENLVHPTRLPAPVRCAFAALLVPLAAYVGLLATGSGEGTPQDVLYFTVMGGACVLAATRAFVGQDRAVWGLLAGAMILWEAGDAWWELADLPGVSPADALYLAFYVLAIPCARAARCAGVRRGRSRRCGPTAGSRRSAHSSAAEREASAA